MIAHFGEHHAAVRVSDEYYWITACIEDRPHEVGVVHVRLGQATRELHRDVRDASRVEKRCHAVPCPRGRARTVNKNNCRRRHRISSRWQHGPAVRPRTACPLGSGVAGLSEALLGINPEGGRATHNRWQTAAVSRFLGCSTAYSHEGLAPVGAGRCRALDRGRYLLGAQPDLGHRAYRAQCRRHREERHCRVRCTALRQYRSDRRPADRRAGESLGDAPCEGPVTSGRTIYVIDVVVAVGVVVLVIASGRRSDRRTGTDVAVPRAASASA